MLHKDGSYRNQPATFMMCAHDFRYQQIMDVTSVLLPLSAAHGICFGNVLWM